MSGATALARAAAASLGRAADDLAFLHVNGWRLDGRNRTALVFARGDGQPALVAKLAVGTGAPALRAEHHNLERLQRSPSEELRASVPAPVAFLEEHDRALLLESVVPGRPLVAPRDATGIERTLTRAVDWLLLFHRGTAPGPDQPLDEATIGRLLLSPLDRYLERFRPAEVERRFLERTRDEASRLAGARLPLVLQHGDFCPQNLLVGEGYGLSVIDWETPFSPRLPAHDLFHLCACLGAPGPGGERDDFGRFEASFLAAGDSARVTRRALGRYAGSLGLSGDLLILLFTAYWAEYALEKAEAEEQAGHGLGVWTLARFEEGTCLNLKRLAETDRNFAFP